MKFLFSTKKELEEEYDKRKGDKKDQEWEYMLLCRYPSTHKYAFLPHDSKNHGQSHS